MTYLVRNKETGAIVEGNQILDQVQQQLRNNPARFYRENELVVTSNPGKTTCTPFDVLIFMAYDAVEMHSRRMRGRYLHTKKGRSKRRHRIRTSILEWKVPLKIWE